MTAVLILAMFLLCLIIFGESLEKPLINYGSVGLALLLEHSCAVFTNAVNKHSAALWKSIFLARAQFASIRVYKSVSTFN